MKLAFALLIFFSFGVSAQESVPQAACLYDFQCAGSQICRAGVCEAPSFQEPGSADTVCGADRRCRIERLKRVNAARRQVRIHEEEEIARSAVEKATEVKEGPRLRLDKPLNVDWRMNRAGPFGVAAGYSLSRHWKAEGQAFYYEDYDYDSYQEVDLTFLMLSAVYFTHGGPVAGYVQGGFHYGFGTTNDGNFSFPLSTDKSVVFHALELQVGIDLQSAVGFHTRLGLAYRPMVYHRVTSSPGVYDEPAKKTFDDWYTGNAMIDVVFLIGWAF